jgi:hypothetical protein
MRPESTIANHNGSIKLESEYPIRPDKIILRNVNIVNRLLTPIEKGDITPPIPLLDCVAFGA